MVPVILSVPGGALVAQWVKRWPNDLAVPCSNGVSLSSAYRPDVTEILLKMT